MTTVPQPTGSAVQAADFSVQSAASTTVPAADSPRANQAPVEPSGTLDARHLHLGYGAGDIVRDVSLTPPPGKLTVLVGPNGCGKSTLLRGMARLLGARSGSVVLNGADITSLPTREVARRLGLLPQGPEAPAGLSVRELVSRGRYPHRSFWQSWSQTDEEAVTEALGVTGCNELAERDVDALSGGQRQRVWIAMVLAQRTGVLLLDEPTTYLDLTHALEVLDLLQADTRRRGTTTLVVLHDLGLAARYADHLVLVKDGQIAVAGAPSEVLTEDSIREVFDLEARIMADPVTGTPLVIPVRPLRREPGA